MSCTYCDTLFCQKCMLNALFETDSDPLQASLPEKFRNPELISEIRREYGLDSRNFSMVLTDYDLRPNVRTLHFLQIQTVTLNDYWIKGIRLVLFSLTGFSASQQLLLIYWITLTAFLHVNLRRKRSEKLHHPALKTKPTIRRTRFWGKHNEFHPVLNDDY